MNPADNAAFGSATTAAPSWELRSSAFRWVLPPGWTDRSIYCFSGASKSDVHPTLTVTTETVAAGTDPAAHAANQIDQLAGQLLEFHLVRTESRMLVTRPCRWAQFTWKNSGGVVVKQSQWHLVQGATALTLTATASEASYEQFEAGFEQAILAFTPLT
jgi:hypothetical protein